VNQLGLVVRKSASVADTRVGVVTEDTLAKLTPTERGVLELLADGGKAAPEIGRLVAKSREHTARLMKSLFEQGFVEREANRQPYEYRLNEKVREALARVTLQEATPAGH
jgi:DNA-binding MarR family transcriptional regulator